MIRLNVKMAIYRRNSVIADWPLIEIIATAGVTAAFSYLNIFTRVQSSDLVANLFLECDPLKGDWHGLCKWVFIFTQLFAKFLIYSAVPEPICKISSCYS